MPQNDTADGEAKYILRLELARDEKCRDLQQKLNEMTAQRDMFRYVQRTCAPLTATFICTPHLCNRKAYLEVVQTFGSDIFDDVPDQFKIKQLIAEEQRIQEILNNI